MTAEDAFLLLPFKTGAGSTGATSSFCFKNFSSADTIISLKREPNFFINSIPIELQVCCSTGRDGFEYLLVSRVMKLGTVSPSKYSK